MISWILKNFRDSQPIGDEVRFPCPRCNYKNFYFNTIKEIGYCQKAKCHYSPTLKDLIKIVGYGPDDTDSSGLFFGLKSKPKPDVIVKFHPHSCRIQFDKKAIEALEARGVSLEKAREFDIRTEGNYICVPVYYEDKLVNIVRRKIDRSKSGKEIWNVSHDERYLYIPKVKTSDFIFRWDFFRKKETLTLLENSFNAILFDVSTNFGSYLSDNQVEMIKNSKIKQVLIFWDSEASAAKAIKRLKNCGIKAESFSLRSGQPDDYSRKEIINLIENAHSAIRDNNFDDWIKSQYLSIRYEFL